MVDKPIYPKKKPLNIERFKKNLEIVKESDGFFSPESKAWITKEYKKKIPFTKSDLYEATSIPGTIKKAKNIWSGMKYTAGKVKGYLNKSEKPKYKQ